MFCQNIADGVGKARADSRARRRSGDLHKFRISDRIVLPLVGAEVEEFVLLDRSADAPAELFQIESGLILRRREIGIFCIQRRLGARNQMRFRESYSFQT